MVSVPVSTMLSMDTIPASFIKLFDGLSTPMPTHGLLAAFLTHGRPQSLKKYSTWKATWPTRQDFENSMPILWPEKLRISNSTHHHVRPARDTATTTTTIITLPPAASGLWNTFRKRPLAQEYKTKHQNQLAQQEKRLQSAWRAVTVVFPDTDWDEFEYYWLIVNTRSFYYVKPDEEAPEDPNEAMALVPFADYFNHADDAVSLCLCPVVLFFRHAGSDDIVAM